jgi:hypothetical protein
MENTKRLYYNVWRLRRRGGVVDVADHWKAHL